MVEEVIGSLKGVEPFMDEGKSSICKLCGFGAWGGVSDAE